MVFVNLEFAKTDPILVIGFGVFSRSKGALKV